MKKIISLLLCAVLVFSFSSCGKKNADGDTAKTPENKDFLTLDSGNISVVSMQGVDGLFVEKGNQDSVKNTTAIIVKNNNYQMLEYALISFKVNEYETADFTVSALPAGESVIVMENFARSYSSDDKYVLDSAKTVFSYCDANPENKDFMVTVKGSDISLKNLTDSPKNATIVYKYYKNGMYYGGIAFRGSFEKIGAGETMTKTSSRFTSDCKIVNIISE